MTYVVKQVKKVVFREFSHLEKLKALVDAKNVGSQRVLEKPLKSCCSVLPILWWISYLGINK
ncbi:hypothetical protein Ahy_A05g024950 [Arachis hypogaea]|uniref:Uncharacterized protein n=1 Tax=Arachis hypogaea TaxID=3818 RepID=A0A445D7H7_ARAHY|nr:hypothetical protein Ahy_A05g024950 [Arachis hypogaea]